MSLAENSFESVAISSWKLKDSGLLEINNNKFSCPLPDFGKSFRINLDLCVNPDFFWIYIVVGVALCLAFAGAGIAISCRNKLSFRICAGLTYEKFRVAKYFVFFPLTILETYLAIQLFGSIKLYLDIQPETVCNTFDANGSFLTPSEYVVDGAPFPKSYTNFQDYTRQLKAKLSSWGDPEIRLYRADCESLQGCVYNNIRYTCDRQGDSQPDPHGNFKIFLYAVMSVYFTKEALKLLVVLTCIKRGGKVPERMRRVCYTSAFAPLLLVRGIKEFKHNIIMHRCTMNDTLFQLVYENVFGNFLKIPLGLMFALGVSKTGLGVSGWASVFITFSFAVGTLIIVLGKVYIGCQKQTSERNFQSALSTVGSIDMDLEFDLVDETSTENSKSLIAKS